MTTTPKLFLATKAMIEYNGQVLIVREAATNPDGTNVGRYDLPGGRLEPGQPFDESLQREIHEETKLEVKVGRPFFVAEWRPVVRGETWQIVGVFFVCQAFNDRVVLSREQDQYLWIDPKSYPDHPLIDDLGPVFEAYLELPDLKPKDGYK